MRTLVTGGAGFIGSNLVKQLLKDGHEVTVLDNLLSGYRSNIATFPEVCLIEGDIRDDVVVAEAMKGVEVVFHLAASVGNKRSIDHPILDAEINVIGTLKILEAARKFGIRKIVASSSAGIFGELKTLPIKEDHPVEPDSPYGSTKLCMEKECLSYAKLYDLEAVCLRYFNVYGLNQRFDAYGNVIPIFAYKMLRGEPLTIFGDGEQTRDFLDVRDVVQANIKAAMTLGVSGAFNIASGSRITINRLVELLSAASAINPLVQHGPPRPGDVMHSLADIRAAHEAFDFTPEINLEDGLREYMVWVKEEAEI
ncbi:SDR family oxidoreductase [Geotalea uraniireducens]|uniref:NAD-dependent epimerase/dehydratase n=1 Tax=Geotalea uraniireducens (strain Rf4) TaxID=351605 RepID=A5GEM5_GEOUR|nr:SDR family oxidoreductase [Geotalea uraniireducens]ABQ25880.1 NAD-dependent epimerase/dehydratase [Geotalea uraniireducens Rf4]